jgi:hypothetical protein
VNANCGEPLPDETVEEQGHPRGESRQTFCVAKLQQPAAQATDKFDFQALRDFVGCSCIGTKISPHTEALQTLTQQAQSSVATKPSLIQFAAK